MKKGICKFRSGFMIHNKKELQYQKCNGGTSLRCLSTCFTPKEMYEMINEEYKNLTIHELLDKVTEIKSSYADLLGLKEDFIKKS